jgi:hypothetical protein
VLFLITISLQKYEVLTRSNWDKGLVSSYECRKAFSSLHVTWLNPTSINLLRTVSCFVLVFVYIVISRWVLYTASGYCSVIALYISEESRILLVMADS